MSKFGELLSEVNTSSLKVDEGRANITVKLLTGDMGGSKENKSPYYKSTIKEANKYINKYINSIYRGNGVKILDFYVEAWYIDKSTIVKVPYEDWINYQHSGVDTLYIQIKIPRTERDSMTGKDTFEMSFSVNTKNKKVQVNTNVSKRKNDKHSKYLSNQYRNVSKTFERDLFSQLQAFYEFCLEYLTKDLTEA